MDPIPPDNNGKPGAPGNPEPDQTEKSGVPREPQHSAAPDKQLPPRRVAQPSGAERAQSLEEQRMLIVHQLAQIPDGMRESAVAELELPKEEEISLLKDAEQLSAAAGHRSGAQQGAEGAQSPQELRRAAIEHLASLSPEQRINELSDPRIPPEVREDYLREAAKLEAAIRKQDEGNSGEEEQQSRMSDMPPEEQEQLVKEGAKERVRMASTDDERTLDEKLQILDPTITKDEKRGYHSLDELIPFLKTDKGVLDTTVKDQFVIKLQQHNFTQKRAKTFLEGYDNLSEQDINELTVNLAKEDDLGEETPLSEEEQRQEGDMRAVGDAIEPSLEQFQSQLADSEAMLPPPDADIPPEQLEEVSDQRKKISSTRARIEKLSGRIQEFLHPDTTSGKITRISGKVLYYSLLTAFMLIVLEMHLIHKSTSSQGGRRG